MILARHRVGELISRLVAMVPPGWLPPEGGGLSEGIVVGVVLSVSQLDA